jgi:hypothetical protein
VTVTVTVNGTEPRVKQIVPAILTQVHAPLATAVGTEAIANVVVPAMDYNPNASMTIYVSMMGSTVKLKVVPAIRIHHYAPSSSAVGILMPLTMGSANLVVPAIPSNLIAWTSI